MSAKFCFFTERQVGIGSAAGAIEPFVRRAGHAWRDVTYVEEGGWIEKLPLPGRTGGTARGFVQVTEQLLSNSYDGLLFLTHNPAVFHPLALAQHPTVLWTDVTPAQLDLQAEHYGHPVDGSRFVSKVKKALVGSTFRRATICAAWSNWARRSFVEDYGVEEERTAVVHPGIDLTRWKLPTRAPSSGLPRLLFVGGDFERKGGSLLLEVLREHFQGRAELDIVTRDPVQEASGVRVHHGLSAGSAPLVELYERADVFVLPTQGDCFSIASMEAMAMGLPVVVSDVGGIADIVEPGASGSLMQPRDGRALRESLDALVTDAEKRRAFGARGRVIVEDKFDAEKSAARLIELVERATRLR